jgi:hypothetical protein
MVKFLESDLAIEALTGGWALRLGCEPPRHRLAFYAFAGIPAFAHLTVAHCLCFKWST